jgi:hypothetical protein
MSSQVILQTLNRWLYVVDPINEYTIGDDFSLKLKEKKNSSLVRKIVQIFFMTLFFPITALVATVVGVGILVNQSAFKKALKKEVAASAAEAKRIVAAAEAKRAADAAEAKRVAAEAKLEQEGFCQIANHMASVLAEQSPKKLTADEIERFKELLKQVINKLTSTEPTMQRSDEERAAFNKECFDKLLPLILTEHSRLIEERGLLPQPSLLGRAIRVVTTAYQGITTLTTGLKTATFLYALASAAPALFEEFFNTSNGNSTE